MSRFGIRNKLKQLAGLGPAPKSARFQVTYVLPDGSAREIEAEEGYTLLMAADAAGLTISTGRRAGGTCPDGGCGLCQVDVLDATGLSPITDRESKVMADLAAGTPHEGRGRAPGPPVTARARLGCWTKIRSSGARVKVRELFDPDSISGDE